MKYSELWARDYCKQDPGASITHAEKLIGEVAREQRLASCQAIQDFIDDIKNLVSPQVIKAFGRAISIANAAKIEDREIDSK